MLSFFPVTVMRLGFPIPPLDSWRLKMHRTTEIGNQHPGSGACSPVGEAAWATADYPLGAHVQGEDVTFAVYSRHATRILLEIYDSPVGRASAGRRPTAQAAQADERDG